MVTVQAPDRTFSFGQNWTDYVLRHLTPARILTAQRSLQEFLRRQDLKGTTFLDIGCGSGLFSLAALRLGAAEVVSIDIDLSSVRCADSLRTLEGSPSNWVVSHGSILDRAFVANLAAADVVYAWGSLHHTGDMWQAIRNTASLIKQDGTLFLAIYNRVSGRGSSEYWTRIKALYNRSPNAGKRLLEGAYFGRHFLLPQLVRLRNPFREARQYEQRRGMAQWTDVRDWLGGYPYEYASAGEVFQFCHVELGLALTNLRTTNTLGVNEFLFHKPD